MTQSPEYPDLAWMPPKSWTNADRKSVQVVVIHATDNREGTDTAEGGARYDQNRDDGTSTHFFHDADSTVQCVRTEDIAHAARTNGNRIGIQHELCGYASQSAAQWADAVSKATLRQAARQVARDCRKWGIPVRKLTATQVAAGVKGICGHVDITNAFPQDRGTHTDPGPNFPWPAFLALVQAEMDGDEMALTTADADVILDRLAVRLRAQGDNPAPTDQLVAAMRAVPWQYRGGGLQGATSTLDALADGQAVLAEVNALPAALAALPDAVLAKLSDPQAPDAQVAAALVSLLGSRKDAVLALMR